MNMNFDVDFQTGIAQPISQSNGVALGVPHIEQDGSQMPQNNETPAPLTTEP